jgi:hypothetical protein
MDNTFFGGAIPALTPLRIQRNSLGAFGFGNDQNGLFGLKGNPALAGTALDDAVFGNLLLPAANSPRSVDFWPIFNTGVPNVRPYQLATGKAGDPLAAGKPFINNFLPTGGDMLRLNMAVPPTPRNDPKFSSEGLVQAAVLGLTDPAYNSNASLQFIPNMDGFPNGRRLEDDVTLIELQTTSGVVLAAIGLWYDDFNGTNPVTPDLVNVLTYRTGVNANDAPFKTNFPYEASPWAGTHICDCDNNQAAISNNPGAPQSTEKKSTSAMGMSAPDLFITTYPNPSTETNTIKYRVETASPINIAVYDMLGKEVKVLVNRRHEAGTYTTNWTTRNLTPGIYYIVADNGKTQQTLKLVKN